MNLRRMEGVSSVGDSIQYCGRSGYSPVSDDDWTLLVINKVVWSCVERFCGYGGHGSDGGGMAMVIVIGEETLP